MLVLLLGDVPRGRLRDAIAARPDAPGRVHVVAPTIVGPLDWLATDEDDAHRQVDIRAFEAEWTLADETQVEGGAGDVDPIQAVEDTLRDFPADEILIASEEADPDLERALRRFGLPITRLDPTPSAHHSSAYRGLRELAGGRGDATPFLLFLGVNVALLLVGLVLSLLVLLVLWLSHNL